MALCRLLSCALVLVFGAMSPAWASSNGLNGDHGSIDSALTAEGFGGPRGFQNFCSYNPELCRKDIKEPPLVHGSRLEQVLRRVQFKVNQAIIAEDEEAGFDIWQAFPALGDCEDYALSKYLLLLKAGLKPSDMRFALAFTELGEYHAVLMVESTQGSIVLDNRFAQPLHWRQLQKMGYNWIAAQSQGDPQNWLLTKDGQEFAASLSSLRSASADK